METRQFVIREIEDLVSKQPKEIQQPLVEVSQKLIAYADTEISYGMAGMKERIASLEQALKAVSRK